MWFPGRTVTWWESRHAPYVDHLGLALTRAEEREEARNLAELVKHSRRESA